MAKNKITDLRDHLFATLEALRDEETPMDLERAKTISDVAQTVINAAKLEVEMARTLDFHMPGSSSFFNFPEDMRKLPEGKDRKEPHQIAPPRAANA